MGRRCALIAGIALGLLAASPAWLAAAPGSPPFWPIVRYSSGTTIPVASGIWYSHYALGTSSGPLNIHHLKLDLRNAAVRLSVGLARDQLISGDETVSSMVRRSGAIAGVNADFFDIGDSGMPLNIMVQEGRLLRSPSGWVALAIGKDGSARFVRYRWTGTVVFPVSGATYWLAGLNTGLVPDGVVAMSNVRGYGAPVPAPGIRQTVVELVPAPPQPAPPAAKPGSALPVNAPAPPSSAPAASAAPSTQPSTPAPATETHEAAAAAAEPSTSQTPQPAADSRTDQPAPGAPAPAAETPAEPAAPTPTPAAPRTDGSNTTTPQSPAAPSAPAPATPAPAVPPPPPAPPTNYLVKALWPQQAYYAPFPKGVILLVGRGRAADWMLRNVAPAMPVQVNLTTTPDWRDATHIVGGGPLLVENGVIVADPLSPVPRERNYRNPVTAVGISQDGGTMLLVAVDGRQPRLSIGLTQPQLAAYMRWLGLYHAMAFDSGGSVTMTVRFPWRAAPAVVNSPSDGHERPVGNALLILSSPLNAQQGTQR